MGAERPADAVRVLLVDDDEEDYLLTRRHLSSIPGAWISLDWVDNFDEALSAMTGCGHDVYLVDYHLGARTGLELLQTAVARGCTSPVIMLTGQDAREVDTAALQAGAADYLVKHAINASLLERSIRYAVIRKQAEEGAVRLESERTAREVAERTALRIDALQRISDVALSDLPADELFADLLQRVSAVLSADTATILLLDEEGKVLRVRASYGLEEEIEAGLAIPVGRGVVGRIAQLRRAEVIPDLSKVADVVSPILRRRVSSMVVAPLAIGSRVIGVMHAGSTERRHFDQDDLQLLELASSRVASAIERARLLEQMALAREEAMRANRAKSDVLASMSHEIRTPINAIIGYADLLEMEIAGPLLPAQRSQLERVRVSGRHLLHLVNGILDLAKIESGRMEITLQPTPLGATVISALALIEPQVRAGGLRLEQVEAVEDLAYLGDDDRVRQILLNLLSNAVKFTPSGGQLLLRSGRATEPDPEAELPGRGPWVYVQVEDSGVGIAANDLKLVFQPFVQVGDERTRPAGGTGLGLTISREFARLMRGDLTLRSELGKGACFTLWLPAHAPEQAPVPPYPTEMRRGPIAET